MTSKADKVSPANKSDSTGLNPSTIAGDLRLHFLSRESAKTKAKRYLIEGRVMILEVSRHRVVAKVRGSGHVWDCGFMNQVWFCSCPNRSTCSHLIAVQSVTAVES